MLWAIGWSGQRMPTVLRGVSMILGMIREALKMKV